MECEISRKEAGLLVLLLVVLTACGGGDDDRGMGTDIGPGEVLPGNVSVDNRTPWDVEVAWLWVGEDGEAQVRVDGDRIVVVQASADDPFGVDVSISG